MPTANETAIERAYEAFGTGDMEAIRNESFATGIQWDWPGKGPLAGHYDGIDAVIAMFGKLFTDSGSTFKVTPESISGFADFVVVRSRASWTGTQGSHDDPYVQVFRMKDNRAADCSIYVNDPDLWEQYPA